MIYSSLVTTAILLKLIWPIVTLSQRDVQIHPTHFFLRNEFKAITFLSCFSSKLLSTIYTRVPVLREIALELSGMIDHIFVEEYLHYPTPHNHI